MHLSELAIRKHVFTWMLMFGFIFFGAIAFWQMGVSQYPDVDFPNVSIRVNYEGASPEIVERTILQPIESTVVAIQGIKSINSTARTGAGTVNVEFGLNKNIDTAVQEIQTQVARAQRLLPTDIEAPVITKSNPEDRPIMWISISSDTLAQRDLMILVRDRIQDQFTTIEGVSEVSLGGYVDPIVKVAVSAEALKQYEFTVDDIVATIQKEHLEVPAGRYETDKVEKNIRVLGEVNSMQELRDVFIKKRGGSPNFVPVRLSTVAKVDEGLDDIRRITRVSGKSSVGMGILKQRGSNAVGVAKLLKQKIVEIQKQLPEGVVIQIANDSTTFIEESVHELVFTISLSALLTALVCWMFLGHWSSAINVMLAIPTSVVGSFIILKFMGFTLNTFTLLALSLAIGIIVDDAIIVLENIIRFKEKGMTRLQAALDGSKEVSFAVLATTVALIAVFLPVAFMDGIIGKFFFQFGVTLSVAVALSLIEALTLAPMRCSQFLAEQHGQRATFIGRFFENSIEGMVVGYGKIIPKILRFRWVVLGASLALFLVSLFFFTKLKSEFAPDQDQSQVSLRIQTKEGSSLAFTDQKCREIEARIKELPELKYYLMSVGGMGGGQVNSANMFVTLKDPKDRPKDPTTGKIRSQSDIENYLRKNLSEIKGARTIVQTGGASFLGGRRGASIEFTLQGPDWNKLLQLTDEFSKKMEETGFYTDIKPDDVKGLPEVRMVPNRARALALGVDVADISKTIQSLYGGIKAGEYSAGGQRIDIRVSLKDQEKNSLQTIRNLFVRNNRGILIPIADLVDLKDGESPQTISRLNRSRAIGIAANPAKGRAQGEAIEKVFELAKTLPPDYYISLSGASQTMQESFTSLFHVMILGLIIAYMVLGSQFNSFMDPVTVLLALPFSISGALASLFFLNLSLNIYSAIGIILLMGLAKKNSILLVEFTNQRREHHSNVRDALTEACPLRLRPILMTSVATIAAAIPPAIAIGPGGAAHSSMAIVVIGGTIISTFFTLFVVPCFYSLTKK